MDKTVLLVPLINLVTSLNSTEVKIKKDFSSGFCLAQNISKVVQYISYLVIQTHVFVFQKNSGSVGLVGFKGQGALLNW